MTKELKPFWNHFFKFNWKFGFVLLLLVCIPRFILVLNANKTGLYTLIGLVMLLSAITPFIFLSKFGLKKIGLEKTKQFPTLIVSLLGGILFSFLLLVIGKYLYGIGFENWYIYIAKSYNIPQDISSQHKIILFTSMAFTGMTFSPIGEELFFRGIVHESFSSSFGEKKLLLLIVLHLH